MIGDFSVVPPTPIQIRTTGRLLGWRLLMAGIDPTLGYIESGEVPVHAVRGVTFKIMPGYNVFVIFKGVLGFSILIINNGSIKHCATE
jgi:hypothetical protein